MPQNTPKILLLAGNSGVGKTFLVEKIVQKCPKFLRIPSLTTKKTTEEEQYQQISEDEFLKKLERDEIIFPANKEIFGAYYGVSRPLLEQTLQMNKIPIITSNLVDLATFPEELRDRTLIVAMISNSKKFIEERLTIRSRPEDAGKIDQRVKISQEEWYEFYTRKTWKICNLLYKIRNDETVERILSNILTKFGLAENEVANEILEKRKIY